MSRRALIPPGSTTSSELIQNTGPLKTFLDETSFATGFFVLEEERLGIRETIYKTLERRERGGWRDAGGTHLICCPRASETYDCDCRCGAIRDCSGLAVEAGKVSG